MSRRRSVLAGSAVLLALVIVGVWWALQAGEGSGDAGTAGVGTAGPAPVPVVEGLVLPADDPATLPALPLIESVPAPAAVVGLAAGEQPLVFIGRVLDGQRRGLPGAQLEFLGTPQAGTNPAWTGTVRFMDVQRLRADGLTTTDRDGRFRLLVPESHAFRSAPVRKTGLVGDSWSTAFPLLRTTAAGFALDLRPVQARASGEADLGDIVLALGASVRGRVLDDAGRPVAGARVSLEHGDEDKRNQVRGLAQREGETGVVSGEGTFLLAGVQAGDATLTVEAEGRPLLTEDITLEPGDSLDAGTLTFETAERLAGTIVDPHGPLVGAHVEARRPGTRVEVLARAISDTTGRFGFSGLPSGPITVYASDEGLHYPAEVSVELPTGQDVSLRLPDLNHLRVRAWDADGRPVTRGEATLRRSGSLLSRAAFGEDGADLPLRRDGTLLVTAEGCAPRSLPVKLSELDRATAGALVLEREAVVRAVARDEDGRPLANLVVSAEPWGGPLASLELVIAGLTDAHGRVELRGLGPGEWSIRGDRLGYRAGRFGATLAAGETREMELVFGTGGQLEGVVREADGTPVRGVSVELGLPPQSALTADDGRFRFEGLPPGETWVVVPRVPGRTAVNITDGVLTKVEIVVPPAAVLSGRVRSGGRDVVDAEVEITRVEGGTRFTQSSDERGEVRFADLVPGAWRVKVRRADGLLRLQTETLLPAGQEQHLELSLSGAHVVVLLRGTEDAAPIAGAPVKLKEVQPAGDSAFSGLRSVPSAKDMTDAQGVARFDDVPAGEYTLSSTPDGRLPVSRTLVVAAAGGEQTLTLDASLGARVEGLVQAADGGDLHVRVLVQPLAPGAEPATATLQKGHYRIDHLPAGTARVAVQQNRSGNTIHRDDIDLASHQLELVAGETAQVDFTVQPLRQP